MRLLENIAKIWMKIEPQYQRRCSPTTLDSSNVYADIRGGSLERRRQREWGYRKHQFSGFRTPRHLRNEANIIIQYYLVSCRISSTAFLFCVLWSIVLYGSLVSYGTLDVPITAQYVVIILLSITNIEVNISTAAVQYRQQCTQQASTSTSAGT